MRSNLKYLILFIGLFLSWQSWGQEQIALSLSAPEQVYANEPFEVSFTINTKGSKDFRAPAFKGLSLLFGPSQSQSSSFQYINGKNYQSFALSYSYRLIAPKEGSYRFGAGSITVDGNQYTSEDFNLRVLPARSSASQHNGSASRSSSDPNSASNNSGSLKSDDLFVRSFTNKTHPYLGEEVILTYRLYTAVPVNQYSIYKLPANKGFWSEDMETDNEQHAETINGKRYIYADIRKVALFPQESGKLTIEPMEIEAIAAVSRPKKERSTSIFDIFDDPFFDQVEYTKTKIKGKATVLQVKPLPEQGKPSDFTGLVGDFKVSFSHDQNKEIRANEAISFTFNVRGSGNIELLQAPPILFPPDFEVYEPKTNHQKSKTSLNVGGSCTVEYIAVPRTPGIYKIPCFSFSFFNPKLGQYKTITLAETVLNVKEGSSTSYPSQEEGSLGHSLLAQDIEHIQTQAPHFNASQTMFFLSLPWWGIEGALLLLFASILYFYRRHLRVSQDVVGRMTKRALKEAKRCLRKGHSFMVQNKRDEFYIEISQALWGFLSHKLNISTSDLSIQSIREALLSRGISQENIEAFTSTLERCEFERFAPQNNAILNMHDLYKQALHVISQIVKELK